VKHRRPAYRLTIRAQVAVLVLSVHATAWLVVSMLLPSVPVLLVCLAAYGAAGVTFVALLLESGRNDRS
jgi:hypothetical protein